MGLNAAHTSERLQRPSTLPLRVRLRFIGVNEWKQLRNNQDQYTTPHYE